MKRIIIFLLGLNFLLLDDSIPTEAGKKLILVNNGSSTFEIYISPNASIMLKKASTDLQKYFSLMSGASIPITERRGFHNQIVLGDKSYILALDPAFQFNQLKSDGFEIETKGSNILICGVNDKGTSNGIYTFLEKYLGCRYYATDEMIIPHEPSVSLTSIKDINNPAFQVRILWSSEGFSPEYCSWNKLTLPPQINSTWNTMWIHTTTRYVSPQRYFSAYPQYFMLWHNKRIPNDIDYSNKAVLKLVIDSIVNYSMTHPNVEYYSVSQPDDNPYGVCQCDSCTLIKDQYGASSAVILNFVNKVANHFPLKTITTLAYYYSRKPPRNFKIDSNVLVFVCNTNPDQIISSNLNSHQNSFFNDLEGWKKLTNNIIVWEYSANMSYPYAPFPNLYLLQNSLDVLNSIDIKGVIEQCSTQENSEFGKLRSYLLSKLLWNPKLNVDSLMNDFLSAYYGQASPYIKEYIKTMYQALTNSKLPLSRIADPNLNMNSFLTTNLIQQYVSLFNKAISVVGNNQELLNRVDIAEQPLRFARLEIYSLSQKYHIKDGSDLTKSQYIQLLGQFVEKAKEYNQNGIMAAYKSPESYGKFKRSILNLTEQ